MGLEHIIFLGSLVLGALLHLLIPRRVLAVLVATAAMVGYQAIDLFSMPSTGGGASMWPVALLFIAAYAATGAALGALATSAIRSRKR